jgi:DNA-binding CsgD family transcriptional regulator
LLSREQPQNAAELLDQIDLDDERSDIAGEAIATRAFAEACAGYGVRAAESMETAIALVTDVKGKMMLSCATGVLAINEEPERRDRSLKELATAVEQTGCFDAFVCAMRASPKLLDAARTHNSLNRILKIAAMRSGDPALAAAAGTHRNPKPNDKALSARELEVLQLAAEGFRNDDIGERLFISPKTVKTHLQNIYAKLDAGSRTEAAMKAKALGLLR